MTHPVETFANAVSWLRIVAAGGILGALLAGLLGWILGTYVGVIAAVLLVPIGIVLGVRLAQRSRREGTLVETAHGLPPRSHTEDRRD